MANQLTPCRLFFIPRELRDKIYAYYSFHEDGYSYDFTTRKLRTKEPVSHQFALVYTCKAVAKEFRGEPFKVNRLSFSTALCPENTDCEENIRSDSQRFNDIFRSYYDAKIEAFCYIAPQLSPEEVQQLARKYPDHIRLEVVR